jgi:hypothetical protein
MKKLMMMGNSWRFSPCANHLSFSLSLVVGPASNVGQDQREERRKRREILYRGIKQRRKQTKGKVKCCVEKRERTLLR